MIYINGFIGKIYIVINCCVKYKIAEKINLEFETNYHMLIKYII